ncbi:hypothetical protein GOODEAATRI_032878, partial [Goodea atripinnis]
MGWKPSLSSSGQSSERKASSSGRPVNTEPLIQKQSCCPKPNIFLQSLWNQRPH